MRTALLLSLFLLLATPASAMIEPPHKTIDYCYIIKNIDQFPDYTFLAVYSAGVITGDMPYAGYKILTQWSQWLCTSRNTRDRIYAVKKNIFNEKEVGYGSEAAQYFKKHIPLFLDSGIDAPVSPLTTYDLAETRKSIRDEMTIGTMNDTAFMLSITKRFTTFEDGTKREELFTPATPAPQLESPLPTASEQPTKEKRPPLTDNTRWKIGAVALFIIAILLGHIARKKTQSSNKT